MNPIFLLTLMVIVAVYCGRGSGPGPNAPIKESWREWLR